MNVTCDLYGPFEETAGRDSVEYELSDGSTVHDLLAELLDEFPALEISLDDEDWRNSTQITRNKTHINHEDGLDTKLSDDDVVRIFSPVTGG